MNIIHFYINENKNFRNNKYLLDILSYKNELYISLTCLYTCRNLEDVYMYVIIIYCLLGNLPISLDVGLHLCARTLWTVGESEDLKESMQTYSGSRGSVLTADLWPALMTALRLDEFQDWKASICISFYDCSRKAIKRTWLVSNYSKRVINTFLSRSPLLIRHAKDGELPFIFCMSSFTNTCCLPQKHNAYNQMMSWWDITELKNYF